MNLDENLLKGLIGIIVIKIDGQTILQNEFCKLNREDTSCKKSVANDLKLEQEGDLNAECIY